MQEGEIIIMGKILEARYLNVDFIVEADFDLSPVVEVLRDNVTFLWKETNIKSSSFGIESKLTTSTTPEEDIIELLRTLEKLPDKLKKLIKDSKKKVFDIGFECGTIDNPIDSEISFRAIQRIAKLGCTINIKLYPWVEHPYESTGNS